VSALRYERRRSLRSSVHSSCRPHDPVGPVGISLPGMPEGGGSGAGLLSMSCSYVKQGTEIAEFSSIRVLGLGLVGGIERRWCMWRAR
jgi:hypothetical protein